MTKLKILGPCAAFLLAILSLSWPTLQAAPDETPAPPANVPSAAPELTNPPSKSESPAASQTTNASPAPRPADLVQEQQRFLLGALEQIRQEAKAVARQNAESITGRLAAIEQSLGGERRRELEAIQKWNLYTLLIVGGFAMLGFLGLLLVAPFLVRSLNRMSDAATMLRLHENGRGPLPATAAAEMALLPNPALTQSTSRFLEAMERVERRIQELEHSVGAPVPASALEPHSNGSSRTAVTPPSPFAEAEPPVRPLLTPAVRTELVMEKGQALLHLGQADRALACFEEALAVEPNCAEVHIKRGQALEKLKKSDEALTSYDRAIGLDHSSTTAYLLKGALLNQLGRYNEALQCYELALRVQQTDHTPTGAGA
jgi:tetratricopeptide (TPR) repeat protein